MRDASDRTVGPRGCAAGCDRERFDGQPKHGERTSRAHTARAKLRSTAFHGVANARELFGHELVVNQADFAFDDNRAVTEERGKEAMHGEDAEYTQQPADQGPHRTWRETLGLERPLDVLPVDQSACETKEGWRGRERPAVWRPGAGLDGNGSPNAEPPASGREGRIS